MELSVAFDEKESHCDNSMTSLIQYYIRLILHSFVDTTSERLSLPAKIVKYLLVRNKALIFPRLINGVII